MSGSPKTRVVVEVTPRHIVRVPKLGISQFAIVRLCLQVAVLVFQDARQLPSGSAQCTKACRGPSSWAAPQVQMQPPQHPRQALVTCLLVSAPQQQGLGAVTCLQMRLP